MKLLLKWNKYFQIADHLSEGCRICSFIGVLSFTHLTYVTKLFIIHNLTLFGIECALDRPSDDFDVGPWLSLRTGAT